MIYNLGDADHGRFVRQKSGNRIILRRSRTKKILNGVTLKRYQARKCPGCSVVADRTLLTYYIKYKTRQEVRIGSARSSRWFMLTLVEGLVRRPFGLVLVMDEQDHNRGCECRYRMDNYITNAWLERCKVPMFLAKVEVLLSSLSLPTDQP